MKRSTIGWVMAGLLALGGAAFAYLFWFAGGSGEPSTELTTPELAATSTTTGDPEGASDTTAPGGEGSTTFVIDQTGSSASFQLDEVLRGQPKTVVGTTDQVAGQMRVDPSDLGATEMSEIVINARTFETDAEQRNRAIRGPVILDSASDEFEFITFSPTSVDGLEGVAAATGETHDFTVTGGLTIKGETQPVTFDVSVVMVDEGTMTGTATSQVLRSDFGIGIPSIASVADVTDEVLLTLEFTALAG